MNIKWNCGTLSSVTRAARPLDQLTVEKSSSWSYLMWLKTTSTCATAQTRKWLVWLSCQWTATPTRQWVWSLTPTKSPTSAVPTMASGFSLAVVKIWQSTCGRYVLHPLSKQLLWVAKVSNLSSTWLKVVAKVKLSRIWMTSSTTV